MAWRIHDQVVRAVIDNRVRGRVTGIVWLVGRTEPLQLDLEGNGWADLAGCVLTVENPAAHEDASPGLATDQRGVCGDLTASRKVKVPTVSVTEWLESHPREPFPFVWDNEVYLEWFSERNGRVVIELRGSRCQLHLSEPAWHLTPQEEQEQFRQNAVAFDRFMERLAGTGEESQAAASQRGLPGAGGEPAEAAEDTGMLEQLARIRALRQEALELAGGEMLCGGEGSLPPDVEEQFWRNILAFERAPCRPLREVLEEDGLEMPPPQALSEPELAERLWQLIGWLAAHCIYLHATDHLSDRDLYTVLVERVLEEEHEMMAADSGWHEHICVSDYGAPNARDGLQVYLRYYADQETRDRWPFDFPGEQVPPHEQLPFDRDRRLPGPPGPGDR